MDRSEQEKLTHTPGPWREGNVPDAIVCDTPVVGGISSAPDEETLSYYGGAVVCESVAPCNRSLIIAAPKLLEACELAIADFENDQYGSLRMSTFDALVAAVKQVRRVK